MSIYQITRTDGLGAPITIQPGQLNGPSGTTASTSLDLYGQGALNWGQGVDRNQLRLLEGFACPGILDNGSLRPVNKDDPATAEYAPDGISTGINYPVRGQRWFNTSNNKTYSCVNATATPAIWEVTGADPDLFLPLVGGTITGGVDIMSANARLTLTSSTGDTRFELNDSDGTKGLIALDQDENTDTIIIRKQVGTVTIADFQITDDGIDVIKGPAVIAGDSAGTIRTEQTTASMAGNTLTTKDWVAAQTSAFLELGGGTIIGDVTIQNDTPLFTLQSNLDSTDIQLHIRDNSGDLRGNLFLDQVVPGFPSNVDHLTLQKLANGVIFSRMTLEDNKIVFAGESATDGAFEISTSGVTQGKAQSPATVAGDSTLTLTTKGYVDGSTVQLGGQSSEMTGDYRFGVPLSDVVINGSTLVSTSGANNQTTITGSTISSTSTATTLTTVSPGRLQLAGGASSLDFMKPDGILQDSTINFHQFTGVINPTPTSLRAQIKFEQNLNNTTVDVLRLNKMDGTGALTNSLVVGDGEIRIEGSSPDVKIVIEDNTSTVVTGFQFVEDLNAAGTNILDRGGLFIRPSTNDVLLGRANSAGSTNFDTLIQLTANTVAVNKQIIITGAVNATTDEAAAQRTFRQEVKPITGSSAPGDFWYRLSTSELYLRRLNDWVLVPVDVATTLPL